MHRVSTYLTSLAAAIALLATVATSGVGRVAALVLGTPDRPLRRRRARHARVPAATQCDALDDDNRLVQFDPATPSHATRVQITAPARLTDLACASTTQCTLIDQRGGEATFNPSSPPATLTFTDGRRGGRLRIELRAGRRGDLPVEHPVRARRRRRQRRRVRPHGSLRAGDGVARSRRGLRPHRGDLRLDQPVHGDQPDEGMDVRSRGILGLSATSATIDTAAGFARAVTCASATQCTAVDQSGHETTFDPQTATTTGSVSLATNEFTQFNDVACPSQALCVAADLAGHLTSFDPQTGQPVASVPVIGVHYLACESATACVADDGSGRVLTFTPGTTSRPTATQIDAGAPLVSVSCPGRSQCTAVDALHELTFDPLSATRAPLHLRTLPGRPFPPVSAVACPALTVVQRAPQRQPDHVQPTGVRPSEGPGHRSRRRRDDRHRALSVSKRMRGDRRRRGRGDLQPADRTDHAPTNQRRRGGGAHRSRLPQPLAVHVDRQRRHDDHVRPADRSSAAVGQDRQARSVSTPPRATPTTSSTGSPAAESRSASRSTRSATR